MRRCHINNTYHSSSIYNPHLTTNSIRFTFVYRNVIVCVSQTILDDFSLIEFTVLQSIFLKTLQARTVNGQLRQCTTQTFNLHFQLNIPLYQFIVDGFQMKIPSYIIGQFIYRSDQLIGRSKECSRLIVVETEQQGETDYLQQQEKKPMVILQKEIKQIPHVSIMN